MIISIEIYIALYGTTTGIWDLPLSHLLMTVTLHVAVEDES